MKSNTKKSTDFEVYSLGLVSASVCTKLSDTDATLKINEEYPTGISSRWEISSDKTFRGGESNPCNCPDHPGNRHILFNC